MTTEGGAADLSPDSAGETHEDGLAEEIEALYRARFAQFARVAHAITGDPEAASDTVQEAFAKALRGAGRLRRRSALEPFMWRTLVNAARDRRRADEARRAREAGPAGLDALAAPGRPEAEPAIAAAVAALPERQRLVLFLRHYADLDQRTIARALSIRRGTVAATLHAAQANLRDRLQETR